jgi:aldose 1-epimerase
MHQFGSPSGAQYEIKSSGHEAVVVETGGGLRVYRADGQDVIDGYGEEELPPASAGHVLAPWPNRIRDGKYSFGGQTHQLALSEPPLHNAIHGLVHWARWTVTGQTDSAVSLHHVLPAQPGYPWTLELTTTWSVGLDGLRATHTATNCSPTVAPFGLGTHPYVRLPGVAVDETTLTVPARNRLLLDGRQLPIGAARVAGSEFDYAAPRRIGDALLDTAFGDVPDGGSAVVLSTVDGNAKVTVWADDKFGWWQVYTGDTLPAPRRRRSVAVEPMTCPPDAFHSGRGVIHLEPGQSWTGTWGITPELAG